MRKITLIIIHCTDSPWGDVSVIRQWHLERGFSDIGYHYLILNSYPDYKSWKDKSPLLRYDGIIERGRPEEQIGAHVKGFNENSIGIALVGINEFTEKQFKSLKNKIEELMHRYDLNLNHVRGHYQFTAQKTCPNFDVDIWKDQVFHNPIKLNWLDKFIGFLYNLLPSLHTSKERS